MSSATLSPAKAPVLSLHRLGVLCGLSAGAWLGAAEAPTKLVTIGFSPFLISLGMVAGVFVARWTVPAALKGTGYIFQDLREKAHLIVWAILAGMLWAVANTLTVFAIRNVGLSVAFPLWNTNSLVGIFWGWLLFNELRGSGARQLVKVLGGAAAIVAGACILAYATTHQQNLAGPHNAMLGVLAALAAGVVWGTMYVPYRKAYISGMNPLSFVTVFTFGELGTTFALAWVYHGTLANLAAEMGRARPVFFWLFLGGFCWVLGDLFQQYASKYIGIGRGIPLSNTNQLWGLAWGALVFGELAGQSWTAQMLIVAGSLVMIAGATSISFAEAPAGERASWRKAVERECNRYGLDFERVAATQRGEDPLAAETGPRRWYELVPVVVALAVFVWLGRGAQHNALAVNVPWMLALCAATFVLLIVCGVQLWRRTRFS